MLSTLRSGGRLAVAPRLSPVFLSSPASLPRTFSVAAAVAQSSPQLRSESSAQMRRNSTSVTLPRDTNQALALGEYAVDFLNGKLSSDDAIAPIVWKRAEQSMSSGLVDKCGKSELVSSIY